ncbi:hypothetical protein THASP1DRAFT_27841 [Thamnocephalis sphaerospora]|uniref:G-protein coupled receptors family 3 profile domain-containing protein n=1 Tax=Thamnocephalis sphaerospora TaxID=78915 RepID=A0A4P9XVT1_9FUNG|nr:hypothetical protein THASP1DRAFT_27841 [Thamnocephalis sphaerospora]|eukprot:RKP10396.1 hypothetical protein THASP1DRAFT_27841 [Thamnocephalis sphaerospora]
MVQHAGAVSAATSRAVLLAAAVVYGASLLALFVAYCNYRYPLIKAKHLPLLTIAQFGGILWYAGFLHASGMVPRMDSWMACNVWAIWAQFVFGAMLHVGVLIVRLYTLHRVFVQRQSTSLSNFAVVSLVLTVPVLGLGFFATIMPQYGVTYNGVDKVCIISSIYAGAAYGLMGLALCALGWLTFQLRNIRQSFNEFKELRVAFIMVFIGFCTNGALVLTQTSSTTIGRYVLLSMNMIVGNTYFWLVIAGPLYNSLFRRQQALREFMRTLARDGVCVDAYSQRGKTSDSHRPLRRAISYQGYSDSGQQSTFAASSEMYERDDDESAQFTASTPTAYPILPKSPVHVIAVPPAKTSVAQLSAPVIVPSREKEHAYTSPAVTVTSCYEFVDAYTADNNSAGSCRSSSSSSSSNGTQTRMHVNVATADRDSMLPPLGEYGVTHHTPATPTRSPPPASYGYASTLSPSRLQQCMYPPATTDAGQATSDASLPAQPDVHVAHMVPATGRQKSIRRKCSQSSTVASRSRANTSASEAFSAISYQSDDDADVVAVAHLRTITRLPAMPTIGHVVPHQSSQAHALQVVPSQPSKPRQTPSAARRTMMLDVTNVGGYPEQPRHPPPFTPPAARVSVAHASTPPPLSPHTPSTSPPPPPVTAAWQRPSGRPITSQPPSKPATSHSRTASFGFI